jgi:hypothetical protein
MSRIQVGLALRILKYAPEQFAIGHHCCAAATPLVRWAPMPHDGTIIPDTPACLWDRDATMAHTRDDGWVWAFVAVTHFTTEAWATVAKRDP